MTETELVERLERLERAHRRLKGFALAALVLATALATIYATEPVPPTITAHQFYVVDNSGKLRVRMGMWAGAPSVMLFDVQGNVGATVEAAPEGASVELMDAQGIARASLQVTRSGDSHIELWDSQGFKMDLGSNVTFEPRTRQMQHTSAASIVMFGNDKEKRVIWKAP